MRANSGKSTRRLTRIGGLGVENSLFQIYLEAKLLKLPREGV